jgi:hypothetical protein
MVFSNRIAPTIRSPSNAGLVMMRVRISWMRSNISSSPEYASALTPYWASAFGVLPPLWSRAAMKPSPFRILPYCSWFTLSILLKGFAPDASVPWARHHGMLYP